MVTLIAAIVIGYLLGSIPTGVWLGKLFKGIDVRKHGSRSTGATNVFRVLGAKVAVLVLLIDIAKGYFACYLAAGIDFGDSLLYPEQLAIIAGISAIIGHLFPIFARFKGGKGIATGAGLLLFISPLEMGFALVIFILVALITKYISLASIIATSFYCLATICEKYYMHYPIQNEIVVMAVFVTALVLFTHRANIGRLLSGTENRIGARKEEES